MKLEIKIWNQIYTVKQTLKEKVLVRAFAFELLVIVFAEWLTDERH